MTLVPHPNNNPDAAAPRLIRKKTANPEAALKVLPSPGTPNSWRNISEKMVKKTIALVARHGEEWGMDSVSGTWAQEARWKRITALDPVLTLTCHR